MTHTMQFRPMRPGLSIPRLDQYAGPLPEGWHWQPKLDDERGVIERYGPGASIYNRHGRPIASNKAHAFFEAAQELLNLFPDQDLFDVALLGFRGRTFPLGTIVLLDLPRVPKTWAGRRATVTERTLCWDPWESGPPPDLVVNVLGLYLDRSGVYSYFASTQNLPGIEGLIGRDPAALYQQGDSKAMCKIKW